jgi:putative SOS response-associated peptidase YedK
MCGRFTLAVDPGELQDAFPNFDIPDEVPIRYNIAPTQPVAVIPNDGRLALDFFLWGLVPSWAKDPSIGNRLINARAETLAQKPSFRSAYRRRRCLILADGFYEWQKRPGSNFKIPHYIRLKSGKPFASAGLWEQWFSPDGSEIKSCTIITTRPNELIAPLHNRMPVILSPDAYMQWLDPAERAPADLNALLSPYPAEQMIAYPVSRMVNSPQNDSPECIQPIARGGP